MPSRKIERCSACDACAGESGTNSGCWYTLWYIWFVLALFLIVIAVLVVLYIKHRSKERSRARRRRRSTRTVPIHIVPTGPPSYTEPSHKPPTYDEAMLHRSSNVVAPVITNFSNRHSNVVAPMLTNTSTNNTLLTTHNATTVQVPGVIPTYNDGYQPPPTSMRMVSTIPGSSPQPLPPSYAASTQGQGYQSQGQGHPS